MWNSRFSPATARTESRCTTTGGYLTDFDKLEPDRHCRGVAARGPGILSYLLKGDLRRGSLMTPDALAQSRRDSPIRRWYRRDPIKIRRAKSLDHLVRRLAVSMED